MEDNSMEELNYYTYIHRRLSDNSIFYVGQGKNKRVTNSTGRNLAWLEVVLNEKGFKPEIVESNLTKQESLDLEKVLIDKYSKEYNLTNRCTLDLNIPEIVYLEELSKEGSPEVSFKELFTKEISEKTSLNLDEYEIVFSDNDFPDVGFLSSGKGIVFNYSAIRMFGKSEKYNNSFFLFHPFVSFWQWLQITKRQEGCPNFYLYRSKNTKFDLKNLKVKKNSSYVVDLEPETLYEFKVGTFYKRKTMASIWGSGYKDNEGVWMNFDSEKDLKLIQT